MLRIIQFHTRYMKNPPISFLSITLKRIAWILLLAASHGNADKPPGAHSTPPGIAPTTGTAITVNIPAPSLSGNLLGEPAARPLNIYLPPAYSSSAGPLPVVYYLPGFGDQAILDVTIPTDIDAALDQTTPFILVVIDGTNRFGGSFFVNSPVTGNWADFVIRDVIGYVDANYRTIADRAARGIAGHSMGGFGALDLAMRNPDVFSSVFAMSPGLTGSNGIADTQMFDSSGHIRAFLDSITALPRENALAALARNPDYFDIAYGMAFAPHAEPPFFQYPYSLNGTALARDKAIWEKWQSGFGGIDHEVLTFRNNLTRLTGLAFDCGIHDEYQWIKRGCDYYDAQLTAAKIPHIYTTHQGRHQDQLRRRVLDFMLPFFSRQLVFDPIN